MTGMLFIGVFAFSCVLALSSFVFGHDTDHGGGIDHGDVSGMPSVFSTRVISLFLIGFSGIGLLAHYVWQLSVTYACLCGVAGGVVMGGLAYGMICAFCRGQASSIPETLDYVGLSGRVSSRIPAKGTGEISVVVKGQLRSIFAASADGGEIAEGQAVKIISSAAGTATVQKES